MAEQPAAQTLSVVTISWNQQDDIVRYLRAMEKTRASTPFRIEMILVDNGSVDGTPAMVREKFPWVKVIENGRNLGFAEGCNVGLRASTGDYLLLLNPDAIANAKALNGMLRFLERNPNVGAVGCMLLHQDGLPQQSAFAEMGPISYIQNHSMLYPLREKLRKQIYRMGFRRKRPYRCGWLQGSCTMVPRHVYEDVGDLEPSFFIYCEDTDWCHRIREAGYEVVHMPNYKLIHMQMGSVKRRPEYFFRRVYRSIIHYANRNLSGLRYWALKKVMLGDMFARLPIYRLRAKLQPSRREATRARLNSVRQLIAIIKARDPDLFDDPPPR